MTRAEYTMEDVRARTYKARDAWWTVFLVDPLAGRLVRLVANRTALTPNQISAGALLVGLGAAGCFLAGDARWLIAGAVLYHLSFVLDCVDGKVARLKGTGTVFGGWLDYVLDRIRVVACALALATGQFRATGRPIFLYLGIAIVFLDMLRYLDALKVGQTRRQMRRLLLTEERQEARAAGGPPEQAGHTDLAERARPVQAVAALDLQQEFRTRFAWYMPIRDWLRRRRVRTHLISGIEFQMAAFIIGPLFDAVLPVTVGAGALMLVFESAIVYKLWLSSKDLDRALGAIEAVD